MQLLAAGAPAPPPTPNRPRLTRSLPRCSQCFTYWLTWQATPGWPAQAPCVPAAQMAGTGALPFPCQLASHQPKSQQQAQLRGYEPPPQNCCQATTSDQLNRASWQQRNPQTATSIMPNPQSSTAQHQQELIQHATSTTLEASGLASMPRSYHTTAQCGTVALPESKPKAMTASHIAWPCRSAGRHQAPASACGQTSGTSS
ncbi:hypothetical protein COO60DRAFT_1556139 [Scenedesmus sp. NREL 46B-D3]|nr:hypothetical protein COO60DRAFT_1556139 [Scenedesmus sp. NREL 46B-D3]